MKCGIKSSRPSTRMSPKTGGSNPGRAGDICSSLTRQPQPPTLVPKEPSCYHFRVLDPRVFAILSATLAAVTIGRCYHI